MSRQDNEDRFKLLFTSTAEALFLHDLTGRFVEVNQAACDSLGYTREELLQKHVTDIEVGIAPETMAYLGPLILRGEQVILQGLNRRKDGTTFPVEVRLSPFEYAGRPHLVASVRDVTEPFRAKEARHTSEEGREEALRESEARYRSLFQNNHSVMLLIDPSTGAIVDANPSACAYYGFSKEELLAKKITEINLLPPGEVFQEIQKAKTEQQKRFEFRHRLANGEIRNVEVFTGPIRVKGKELLYSIIRDITARKEAEAALRESESKYRSLYQEFQGILNAIPDGVFLLSPDLKVVWANGLAALPLNAELSDFTGQPCYQVRHGRSTPCDVCPVRECLATGKPASGESTTPDGRIWELRALPIFGDQGEVKGVIELGRNITERKLMEKALRESEARFRQVVEFSPIPIGISASDGFTIEYVNPKFVETFGYIPEEIPTLEDWFRLAYPDPAYRQKLFLEWQEFWEERIKPHAATEVRETEVACKDGSTRIIQLFVTLMNNKSLMVCHDLTERKRAEQALRDSQRRLSEIIDFLPDATFAIDLSGKVITWNRAIEEMTGVKAEDMIGKGNYEYALPFYGSRRPILIDLAFKPDDEIEKKYAFVQREGDILVGQADVPVRGEKRLLWAKARRLYDAAGKTVGALETIRDITEQQQTVEALKESEGRFRQVVESSPLPIGICYPGVIEYINPKFIETFGYKLEEIHKFEDWFPLAYPDPAYRQVVMAKWQKSLEKLARLGGPEEIAELEITCKDGSKRIVEGFANLMGNKTLVVLRDLTERKRAEQALGESEARFRQVVESSPLPIAIAVEGGMIEYVNHKFVETFGYTLEDVPLLEDWYRRAYPDPDYRWKKIVNWEKALEQAGSESRPTEVSEVEVTCKDGSQKIIDIFGTLVGNKTLGVFNDVTERKRAGEVVRESEARFRLVVENSPLAIAILNGDQGEYLNPKFVETFGYTLEDMPLVEDWFHLAYPNPDYRQWVVANWRQALEEAAAGDGSIRGLEVDVACKDGSVRTVESWGVLVGGKALVFCKDLTEIKKAQEEQARLEAQMREVQKLESLGVLAGGIAHDFNNLLMAILGNADLALLALSPASPARPNVEEIARASQRAADLCRQMLAYSGKGRFMVGRYDLTEIVREMTQMLKVSVSKKASLQYSFAADLPAVEVDATQMRQVIMNLITNASESLGDESGMISVATGVMDCDRAFLAESHLDDRLPEGRYVFLEVADTGCGMSEETRRRIFDPFFTTKFTGRGLGLAAVLGIVRGHRGAIKVSSQPRQGTTFTLLLPAVAWEPGDRVLVGTLAAPPSRQGTVLLVDDDPHVRRVAGEMLKRLGIRVLTAEHGKKGVEIFRANTEEIDCVLLDLTMPGMGGEETFQAMRKVRPDVRVILSSGYDEQEVTRQFAGLGLAGFIQKPYTVVKLQEILNRVLF
ncbi:MAG: PAS domain S-box protein [Deltaproteobacteria bacterium]|nr:MAG: PAS domain S-box protein [Deltaproteobacteria bacterium]